MFVSRFWSHCPHWGITPRAGAFVALQAAFCLAIFAGGDARAATGDSAEGRDADDRGFSDFAEIYVDQYFEPEDALKLETAGERRAEALAHYSIGLSLEAQQRVGDAIGAFREVLEIAPGEVSLARKVAYLLAETGDREGGREVLERAYQANSDSPRAAITLSEYLVTFLLAEDGAKDEAMRLAKEAADKHSWHPAAWEHLVRMQLLDRQMDEARATVMRALERNEQNPEFYIRLGRVAQRIWPLNPEQKSPSIINGIFEKALERGGDNASVRESVGDYFHDSRQPERAREVFEKLVEDFPDHLEIREKLARVYGALGDEAQVIETLEGIVEIDPQAADIHRELGGLFVGKKDFEKATHHFREAMRLTTGTTQEYTEIGRMMIFDAEMVEEAIPFLERGAYLHPEDPRLPFLLTFAFARVQKYDDALPWFEKTVELASQSQPDLLDAVFYYRYGAAVERSGDIDRASDLFRAAMDQLAKMDVEDERAQALRAEVYNYLGYMWLENDLNIDEAGELIKEAHSIVPDSGAITDSLGWFYFKKGKFEEAKTELLKAESMVEEPDSVIYDHLAQTFFGLGDAAKAAEYLRKAVELDPENEEFRSRLEEYEKAAPEPSEEKKAEEDKPAAEDEAKEAA